MSLHPTKAKVRVPASTSNLGPGFDCLGLALSLHNEIEVSLSPECPAQDPFLQNAASAFFQRAGLEPMQFGCRVTGEVPRSRGLGSSVTVRLGLMHGLNQLLHLPLPANEIFSLCVELEGHPDNAAAAVGGGFTICVPRGGWTRYPVHERLTFVLAVPPSECSTDEARKAVPEKFTRAAAVFNLSYSARIAASFASGRYEDLAGAFEDRIHQPYRGKFLSYLHPAIAAAREAGALGGWLSGSGSTVACACLAGPEAVGEALRKVIGDCAIHLLKADNEGLRILSET